jgi:hypothetical protein
MQATNEFALYSEYSVNRWRKQRSSSAITCSRFYLWLKINVHGSSLMEAAATTWWVLILVKKLELTTRPHKHPYHIQWLNDSDKAKVTQIAQCIFSLVHILILWIVMWYLCKLVHFCWVIHGNMIMMLSTMVEIIHIHLCIRAKKIFCNPWHLLKLYKLIRDTC